MHESGFVETVPFEHRKLWWFQIPQVLLQGARHSRSTPFAGVGVATSTRHPLSGAFPAAPAAAPQRRAGAQAREHQARPDLRPRQGECCKSSRGNYRLAGRARKTCHTTHVPPLVDFGFREQRNFLREEIFDKGSLPTSRQVSPFSKVFYLKFFSNYGTREYRG